MSFTSGCAPSSNSAPVLVTLDQTEKLLSSAEFSGAPAKSPYEFFSAEIYLTLAKESVANGQKKTSDIYLRMAYDQAKIAYDNAKKFSRAK